MKASMSNKQKISLLYLLRQKRRRRKRLYWVHPILQRRNELGEFSRLVKELELERESYFFQYFRLSTEKFRELARLIGPKIARLDTNWRKSISAEQRLAITLRFLATGDSYRTIGTSYRVGWSTISGIVPDTCKALYDVLQPLHMSVPGKKEWRSICDNFWNKWQFPNCLGAIDGKHVVIRSPANSGSKYFNYKGAFSIVLLAVVDADYKFILISVGGYGRQSDGGTFADSELGHAIKHNTLSIPNPKPLPGQNDNPIPHVFVADAAFPLSIHLMRPYPGKCLSTKKTVFNYRLSRARRTVENAFGILSQRFRVFLRPIAVLPHRVDIIVKAACCLHNYLQVGKDGIGGEANNIADAQRLEGMTRTGCNASTAALNIRENFADYFVSPVGSLSWQYS
uniref:protein ALP1-like n=1 Tax=Styela clava TaxID=7725 RepID=UPI001939284B|nr:protein ALP1-like [Styela clava]